MYYAANFIVFQVCMFKHKISEQESKYIVRSLRPSIILNTFFFSGGNFDKENKTPDKNYISKREFSFTLEDDIYLRYMSFSSADDLKDAMVRRIPHKIDIGAVFNAKPSDHKKIANFQVNSFAYLVD